MQQDQNFNNTFDQYSYFSRAKFIGRTLLLIWMIIQGNASAQESPTLYTFSYYKILPGKEYEVRGMIKNVHLKVQQDRVNKGAISSWYLYEVLIPSGTNAEYDLVMITTASSAKKTFESPYPFDSAFKKIFLGKDAKFFNDYHSRISASWSLIKEEIFACNAVADSSFPAGLRLKYIMTDFMQPREGKGGQYVKMELDTFRLIHKERIRLGAISQWASLGLMMPYDTKNEYSYLALNYYKEMDKIFDFRSSKYEEAVKETFPTKTLSELFQSAFETVNNTRAELLRLVVYTVPVKR